MFCKICCFGNVDLTGDQASYCSQVIYLNGHFALADVWVSFHAALLDKAAWRWKRLVGLKGDFASKRGGEGREETTFHSVLVLLGSCSQNLPSRSHLDAWHTGFHWNYVYFIVWFLLYFTVTRKGSVRSPQVPKRRSFDPRQGWWYRTLWYRKSLRQFSTECCKIKT